MPGQTDSLSRFFFMLNVIGYSERGEGNGNTEKGNRQGILHTGGTGLGRSSKYSVDSDYMHDRQLDDWRRNYPAGANRLLLHYNVNRIIDDRKPYSMEKDPQKTAIGKFCQRFDLLFDSNSHYGCVL